MMDLFAASYVDRRVQTFFDQVIGSKLMLESFAPDGQME